MWLLFSVSATVEVFAVLAGMIIRDWLMGRLGKEPGHELQD